MDTKKLLSDAKARFSHNSAKQQLKDKYQAKLSVASQGGLWKATPELIAYLSLSDLADTVILLDSYENPILVNREDLHDVLQKTYNETMALWYAEFKEIENNR